MLLYHISRSSLITDLFIPRLPELSISLDEAQTIHRISVSSRISGCFSAVYFGCSELKYSRWINNLYDDTPIEEDNKYLYPFKLYVFDSTQISKGNLISPSKLLNYGVNDALLTDEYWILEPIKPIAVYNYYVTNFNGSIEYFGKDKRLFNIRHIKGIKERIL